MSRVALFLFVGLLLAVRVFAQSSDGSVIPFQGKLTSATGQALTGQYDFQFTLYDSQADGTSFWTSSYAAITVQNGFYSVRLGSQVELTPDTLLHARFLDIKVRRTGTAAYDTLSPRVRLSHSPFAVVADTIDGLDSSDLALYEKETQMIVAHGLLAGPAGDGESAVPALRFSGDAWEFSNDGVNFEPFGGHAPESIFVKSGSVILPADTSARLEIPAGITAGNDVTIDGTLYLGSVPVGFDNQNFSAGMIHADDTLLIDVWNPNGPSMLSIFNSAEDAANLEIDGRITFWGELAPGQNPGTMGQVLTSAGPGLSPGWTDLDLSGYATVSDIADFITLDDASGNFLSLYGGTMVGTIDFATGQEFPGALVYGPVSDSNLPVGGFWNLTSPLFIGGAMTIEPGSGFVGVGTDAPAYTLDVSGDINVDGTLYVNGEPFGAGGGAPGYTAVGDIPIFDIKRANGFKGE
ncbi:MAG: hypothetical protein NUW37_03285, partial [Planctomycetes bacterium]|nr:hypothetical protein [Planctomycetota bacterium]